MLTHTGRTYAPGEHLARRCEQCEAAATWVDVRDYDVERLCRHHAEAERAKVAAA